MFGALSLRTAGRTRPPRRPPTLKAVGDLTTWVPVLVVVALVAGWYLSFTASRIDRLHHRVESSRAALDAQLARRAGLAVELAPRVGDPQGPALAAAASAALTPSGDLAEVTQSGLTRALADALAEPDDVHRLRREALADQLLTQLSEAAARSQMARRFHNDAVAQTQRVRRKWVVRTARLAGRAAMPQMVEIDDRLPPGLSEGQSRVP
jgi:hypothetical protein